MAGSTTHGCDRMIAGLRRRPTAPGARGAVTALVAQALTLTGLLAPIAFGLTGQLPDVVLAAAIATILSYPATIAALPRLPGIVDEGAARLAERRSTAALLGTTGAAGLVAAIAAVPAP